MENIYVIYWSQSGNTQAMAEAVGDGIESAGKNAVVTEVGSVKADELKNARVFALGCPAMGGEELDAAEMEPFVSSVEEFAAGKIIGLFGSYGWGDGQWMRDWVDRMKNAGADVINGEGTICQEMPDGAALEDCRKLGKQLADA